MKKIIICLIIGVLFASSLRLYSFQQGSGQTEQVAEGEEIKQVKFAWLKQGEATGKKKSCISKIGDKNFKISTENGLPSNQVKAVTKLPGGGYAFGTKHGLCFWQDGELMTFTGPEYVAAQNRELKANSHLPHNEIKKLLVDGEGALWVATGRGICRIKNGQWELLKIKAAQQENKHRMVNRNLNDIQELFLTSKKEVVFGSRKAGVFIFNPKSKEIFTIYNDKDANHWVTAIDEDRKGNIWVAIRGVGVLKYDGKKYQIFTEKESWIPSRNMRSLCVDKQGNLWVDGLKRTEEGETEKSFDCSIKEVKEVEKGK